MLYNLVMLSGTVVSDVQYIKCKTGNHVALFHFHFPLPDPVTTMPVAAYENVGVFCHENLEEGSTISIKAGNFSQYDGEIQIIANSIELFNSAGKVVSSVKKESRKVWSNSCTVGNASAAESPAGESPNELLERIAKLEKMLSDAEKSHKK